LNLRLCASCATIRARHRLFRWEGVDGTFV
jgi:hypothetical protein